MALNFLFHYHIMTVRYIFA